MPRRDVFLCHASADKAEYVHPLADALSRNGISYWLDEAEIEWGERITEKINGGLAISRFVIVVLSSAFLTRRWPQVELGSALSLEAATGEVSVLPILATGEEAVFARYPLLREKRYLRWQDGLPAIADALMKKLGRGWQVQWRFCHPAGYSGPVWIQIVPKPDDRSKVHEVTIRWGPWQRSLSLRFADSGGIALIHMKGDDSLSIPLVLSASLPCYVVFGQGPPPIERIEDINAGWTRV